MKNGTFCKFSVEIHVNDIKHVTVTGSKYNGGIFKTHEDTRFTTTRLKVALYDYTALRLKIKRTTTRLYDLKLEERALRLHGFTT
jgi:hypothetical protein